MVFPDCFNRQIKLIWSTIRKNFKQNEELKCTYREGEVELSQATTMYSWLLGQCPTTVQVSLRWIWSIRYPWMVKIYDSLLATWLDHPALCIPILNIKEEERKKKKKKLLSQKGWDSDSDSECINDLPLARKLWHCWCNVQMWKKPSRERNQIK